MFANNRFVSFLVKLIMKLRNDDIFASSAQLSYYLILGFFPFMVFLLTLVGYFQIDSTLVLNSFELILPESVNTLITSTLNQIINVRNGELLWFSLIVVSIAASTGFRGVIKAINRSYGVRERRWLPLVWLISIIGVMILTIVILINLIFWVFGKNIGLFITTKFGLDSTFIVYWGYIRFGLAITSVILCLMAIYKFTPANRPKVNEVYKGAIFSTATWFLASYIFSSYINSTNKLSMLYGSLSAMFGLIMWIYISSFIFILGMEINSVISIKKKSKEITIGKGSDKIKRM